MISPCCLSCLCNPPPPPNFLRRLMRSPRCVPICLCVCRIGRLGKLMPALDSTIILGSESRGTHDHLSHVSGWESCISTVYVCVSPIYFSFSMRSVSYQRWFVLGHCKYLRLVSVELFDYLWITNWKGSERTRPWHNRGTIPALA
jgi:hypothetical protein